MTTEQRPMAGHPAVQEFTQRVWQTHQRKNSDYSEAGYKDGGDIFSNFRTDHIGVDSRTGVLVRMTDKWQRLCNLHTKGYTAVGESIDDALLDLAGYAAIYYAMLQDEKEAAKNAKDHIQ